MYRTSPYPSLDRLKHIVEQKSVLMSNGQSALKLHQHGSHVNGHTIIVKDVARSKRMLMSHIQEETTIKIKKEPAKRGLKFKTTCWCQVCAYYTLLSIDVLLLAS
jgi:hypothetical protein